MPQGSIESSPSIVFMVPAHRVEIPILAPFVTTLIYRHHHLDIRIDLLKVI